MKQMSEKDERIKVMNEVLGGMKVQYTMYMYVEMQFVLEITSKYMCCTGSFPIII